MAKQEKVEKVKEIKERLQGSQAAVLVDYRGLTVPDIGEVRTALLDAGAQFAVVKNTLAKLAVRDAGLGDLEAFLEGPTAIAYVSGDPVLGAKALVDAAKRFPVMEVKGGLAEGRVLTGDQIKELAALDTREEMLAKIAGMLGAHMSRAAFAFQALQSRFVALLEAYREKLPGEEAPAAQEEAPATEEGAETEGAPAGTPAQEPPEAQPERSEEPQKPSETELQEPGEAAESSEEASHEEVATEGPAAGTPDEEKASNAE